MLNIYTIFDKKVVSYGVPFTARNHGEALRSFEDLALDQRTTVGRHPADFVLCFVGRFDQDTGIVHGCDTEIVAEASQFAAPEAAVEPSH